MSDAPFPVKNPRPGPPLEFGRPLADPAAALERTAIDDAYQDAIKVEFDCAVNTLTPDGDGKADGPAEVLARWKIGIAIVRQARAIALDAIGGQP